MMHKREHVMFEYLRREKHKNEITNVPCAITHFTKVVLLRKHLKRHNVSDKKDQ